MPLFPLRVINGLFRGCTAATARECIPNSTLEIFRLDSNVHTGMGRIYVVITRLRFPLLLTVVVLHGFQTQSVLMTFIFSEGWKSVCFSDLCNHISWLCDLLFSGRCVCLSVDLPSDIISVVTVLPKREWCISQQMWPSALSIPMPFSPPQTGRVMLLIWNWIHLN